MVEAPKCYLCGVRHWSGQGCKKEKKDDGVVRALPRDDGARKDGRARAGDGGGDDAVPNVQENGGDEGRVCPTCGQLIRRKYATAAERQKAYRERQK